jgi:hypothetical protein
MDSTVGGKVEQKMKMSIQWANLGQHTLGGQLIVIHQGRA